MEATEHPPGVPDAIELPPPPPPELETFAPPARPHPTAANTRARAFDRKDGWRALLDNRFILAALGGVVILLLTAIVLVAIGYGDDTGSDPANVAAPSDDETPLRPIGGLSGTTVIAAGYHNGPGATFVILGTIPRGATVAVVGRNTDNTWLQVRYPPNSNLKGWVDAKLLNVHGDTTVLAIAGPGPVAVADITFVPATPTFEPNATATEEQTEPTRVSRPTRTATARSTVTPPRTPSPTSTPENTPTPTVPPIPTA